MKKIICVLLCVLLCLPLAVMAEKSTAAFDAADPHIRYIGRWVEDDGIMQGYFEGQIVLRFTGTSLACAKKSGGNVAVSIDSGAYKAGELSGTLAKGLAAGEHTASIVSLAQNSRPHLAGILLDEGASLLETEDKPTVEFIGGSSTEGYIPGNNSVLNSYAHILAEQKGWYRNIVAFGGITLTAGYGNPDAQGMVKRYFVQSEYAENENFAEIPAWDTSRFAPDYLVINLGTNDHGVSDSEFIMAGMELLTNLRKAYPQSKILVLTPFTQDKIDAWHHIEQGLNDPALMLVETGEWGISFDQDNIHPDAAGHAILAQKTAEALEGFQSSSAVDTPLIAVDPAPTDAPTDAPVDKSADKTKKSTTASYVLIPFVIVAGLTATFLAVYKKKKKSNNK